MVPDALAQAVENAVEAVFSVIFAVLCDAGSEQAQAVGTQVCGVQLVVFRYD